MTNRIPSDPNAVPNASGENSYNPNVPPTDVAYKDGYVTGRVSEQQRASAQRLQYEREKASESNGVAGGILLGILLAALVGGVAALMSFNNRSQTVSPTSPTAPSPVTVPQVQEPSRTTIIERTREVVPAPAAPAPNVVIEAPSSAPAQPAPQNTAPTAPTAPQDNTTTTAPTTTAPVDSGASNGASAP